MENVQVVREMTIVWNALIVEINVSMEELVRGSKLARKGNVSHALSTFGNDIDTYTLYTCRYRCEQ